jgi:gamma-glutamylcyclotransferase (GGCT)/AIG2-like uncharacterized protein YtfP
MSANPYYFAYGSNLNSDDWEDWCRRADYRAGLLQPLRTGWLVDHHPIYHYRSTGRGGGALDMMPSIGHVTPGVLFAVGEYGWSALDAKEGAPGYYDRQPVTVLDEAGGWQDAITYCVVPQRREECFVPPTGGYESIVQAGLVDHGLPIDAHRRASQNARPIPLVRHLFVYGTLQSGHSRADVLPGIASRQPARISGRLFDLGAYPGWQPGDHTTHPVQGELLELTDPVSALSVADTVEGCAGYRSEALYHRVLVRAVCAGGERILAWCYRVADSDDAKVIASGRWDDSTRSLTPAALATCKFPDDTPLYPMRRDAAPRAISSSASGVR